MNGHRIFPSKYIKYLGIYLDETLNGRFHCYNLAKRLKRANGMLCKARHYINAEDLKILYYAIFSSHLIYGCQIWGQYTNTFNQMVFKLQNRALRIISFANFGADENPLFHNLNIIKLSDQITIQNCLFVHDTLNHQFVFMIIFYLRKIFIPFLLKVLALGAFTSPSATQSNMV